MNGLSHWDGIKHFSADSLVDNWGDPHNVERALLEELDRFRIFLNAPIIVTSCFRPSTTGNEGGSQHAHGLAADIVVPTFKGTILDLFFAASRFNFKGIGIYRDWEYGGKKTGGLHVDMRHAPHRALWFCYKDTQEVQRYVALSQETLHGFGLL